MTRLDAIKARLRAATPMLCANGQWGTPIYDNVQMRADLAWLIEQLAQAQARIAKFNVPVEFQIKRARKVLAALEAEKEGKP